MASKKSTAVLSREDILRGGESAIRQVEVPGLLKGGKPGIICHRPMSAGEMIAMQVKTSEAEKIAKDGGIPPHMQNMVELLADVLTDPDGERLFTYEQLMAAPGDTLTAIMTAIAGGGGGKDQGNVLSGPEETGSGSSTESLSS